MLSNRLYVVVFIAWVHAAKLHENTNATNHLVDFDIRLVRPDGHATKGGLLQVRHGAVYGTVCGMNSEAAKVVCRELGYKRGSSVANPCAYYAGSDWCGTTTSQIGIQDLFCEGHELSIAECSFAVSEHNKHCASHTNDAIVYCTNEIEPIGEDGAVRVLSFDGAPSVSGHGRLEVFRKGIWAPVCRDGFAPASEAVACKQMGFTGGLGDAHKADCRTFNGLSVCGAVAPRTSKVACHGSEERLMQCPLEVDDAVFCAAEESVVVSCVGDGNTVGWV